MTICKTVLLIFLLISTSTKLVCARSDTLTQKELDHYKPLHSYKGMSLPSLKTVKLSDIHLAKPVKYFDIKQYDREGKYVTGWSFDMAAYKKLSSKEKKKIRSVKAVKSKSTFWRIHMNDGVFAGFYNLHYLDSDSEVHTIASRKALLTFLGTIDTAAEFSMLFLGTPRKIRYKKIGDIYNIRIDDISYSDCDGCGEPACTLYVTQQILNSRGKILLNKFVEEQSFKSEKECRKL